MQKQNYFFLFLFFALISGGLHAQVVTIPDANFLAKLIAEGVDTNGDGQIQQTEASAVTNLDVSNSSISSLVGIEYFGNLKDLNCYNNQLATLDVSSLVNLKTLGCNNNQLATLDLSTLVNLQWLYCYANQLTTLDVSGLVNLQTLDCYKNQLTTLDVSGLVNLQILNCYINQLATLDVSALVNLQQLYCYNNQLTTLDVGALINLQQLYCYNNQLTTLDVSGLVNLQGLNCSDNQLTTLAVSTLVNLQGLNCSDNQLTTLDVSVLVNLEGLNCSSNQLNTLDVSALVNLKGLNCSSNQLTTLDVTASGNLEYLECSSNQLTTLDVSGLVNLKTFYCSNNQLTTLDMSALVNLQNFICSSNQLTTLNVSTLVNLQSLSCSYNQLTTLNVSTLVNLGYFYCSYNQLTALDLSASANLQSLNCKSNQLIVLNIKNGHTENSLVFSSNPSLHYICIDSAEATVIQSLISQYGLQNVAVNTLCGGLQGQAITIPDPNFLAKLITEGVDTNGDGQIQLIEALVVTYLSVDSSNISSLIGIESFTSLQELDCSNNQLTALDVNALVNLQGLYCQVNQLTTLNVSSAVNLQYLNCSSNKLTTLDVSTLVKLWVFDCSDNQLTNLDVTNLFALWMFNCQDNQLTTLDVSSLSYLQTLVCGGNQLTTLDVSYLISLESLECYYNQLTSLDVSGVGNLGYLNCSGNSLTSLDVSPLGNLQTLYCANNQLISLNIKNGSKEYYADFSSNPNLQSICIDSDDLTLIQNNIAQYGLQNVGVSTLCTYSPGGNYNTLSGTSSYDGDMNGCSLTDSTYRLLSIAITNGIDSGYTYTNLVGEYTTFLDTGTYALSPQPENPTYFSVSPLTTNINFPNNNNNTQIQDFCIVPNGVFPDVEIAVSPMTIANPGFDATYKILFHNKGTTVAAGNITLDFMGNKMSLVSSSLATSTQTTNQLTWAYSNLQPFESRNITLVMNISPPPTNNIGDTLNFNANISLANDALMADNDFPFNQIVIGSFDPNDKTCLEGNTLANSKIGEYLHYMIRFQNTGNYPAKNVVVVDSLDASKYDIASLQVLEASHKTHIDLKNKVLQFYFENIQLADSFSNEPASHGYITYKIKTKATLPQNSSVSNKAEIYFDYNPAVVTNTATTTFTHESNASTSTDFQCFPNPAHNLLSIKTSKAI